MKFFIVVALLFLVTISLAEEPTVGTSIVELDPLKLAKSEDNEDAARDKRKTHRQPCGRQDSSATSEDNSFSFEAELIIEMSSEESSEPSYPILPYPGNRRCSENTGCIGRPSCTNRFGIPECFRRFDTVSSPCKLSNKRKCRQRRGCRRIVC